jgi:excisionase family DNA binding protein
MPEEVLTAQQVANELRVHIGRVYKWIQDGELVATDLGTPARHNYRINRSDLEDFKRRRRTDQKRQDDENSF